MSETAHNFLLRWLIFIGVIVTAAAVAWHQELFALLLENDPSRISIVILLAFVSMTGHAGWRIAELTRQLGAAHAARRLLEADGTAVLRLEGGTPTLGSGRRIPVGWLAGHIAQLLRKFARGGTAPRAPAERSQLLDALSQRVRGPQQFGWLVADLMIKLGLLGTVIGFILMLGAVTDVEQLDVALIQQLLTKMSGGMRVALFTTVCGLVAGTLLGIQYHLADRAADELLASITEIVEVHVVPRLLGDETSVRLERAD